MSQQEPCCPNPNLKPQGNGYYWCLNCGAIIEPEIIPVRRVYVEFQPDCTYSVTVIDKFASGLPIDQALDLALGFQR